MDLEYLYEFDTAEERTVVDYAAEMVRLERKLDSIKGTPSYPENIVHYLTMRDLFSEDVEPAGMARERMPETGKALGIRKNLTFLEILTYNNQGSYGNGVTRVLVGYDFAFDMLFFVDDVILWRIIKELPETFSWEVLSSTVRRALGKDCCDESAVAKTVETLMATNIVGVVANSAGR
jgi:hypothetical protein